MMHNFQRYISLHSARHNFPLNSLYTHYVCHVSHFYRVFALHMPMMTTSPYFRNYTFWNCHTKLMWLALSCWLSTPMFFLNLKMSKSPRIERKIHQLFVVYCVYTCQHNWFQMLHSKCLSLALDNFLVKMTKSNLKFSRLGLI